MFKHGGQLERIKKQNPKQTLEWIDLSTGISPYSYPMVEDASNSVSSLPQQHEVLEQAACDYYGVAQLLVTPGSMWSIQNLPMMRKLHYANDSRPVLIPGQGFNEHQKAWQSWGFDIELYDSCPTERQLRAAQACVVINPNNPTGHMLEPKKLLEMLNVLSKAQAWLVVDEAFIDSTENLSVSRVSLRSVDNLIVLKSFGKYFGLPGLRVGALIAPSQILATSKRLLNEWSISSAAQSIAIRAWKDTQWQLGANEKLRVSGNRLHDLLNKLGYKTQGTHFFQTHYSPHACALYIFLLAQGIYIRLLDDESGVRFGLPRHENHWQRIERALSNFKSVDLTKQNTKQLKTTQQGNQTKLKKAESA